MRREHYFKKSQVKQSQQHWKQTLKMRIFFPTVYIFYKSGNFEGMYCLKKQQIFRTHHAAADDCFAGGSLLACPNDRRAFPQMGRAVE